jgi:hypothetical protein
MSGCPHLSKDQIDKILNCQDSFMGKMQELDAVVKKLNTAALQLEADFLQPPEIAANYANKKKNIEASEKADAEIKILMDEYEKIVIAINDNIEYYNTLLNYQTNMDDLLNYYYKTIDKDKDTIEKIKSKKAIAQRMTTYYKDKTESVSWYNYYLKYLYWIVLIIIGALFAYFLFGKAKNYALAGIAIKCDNMIKDYKARNVDPNSNWMIRICNKTHSSLEKYFQRNTLRGGAGEEEEGSSSTSQESGSTSSTFQESSSSSSTSQETSRTSSSYFSYGIKSTGFIFFLLLLIPFIILPIMNFLRPYFFPYA